ncbi:uncharacterized protein PAC_04061 [Phialocephala subalpina]|uniref:2EXR domain-containing protein n=1 Tax=Phialocephala subalpina TaxID=576137 RepID=A0A1L7WN46_9HELO|nr:uncharacterized protein PAC_04061 [Phialocephala subalpina]
MNERLMGTIASKGGEPALATFPRFQELPVELRIMIWNLTLDNIPKPRVVTVRSPTEPSSPDKTVSTVHILLHTCKESRELILPRYTSAFGLPRPGWEYTGSRMLKGLQKILRKFRLPSYSIAEAVLPITIHMNEYPAKKGHERYAIRGKPYPPLSPSLWFDAENDILLFRHAIKNGWIGWSTVGNNILHPYGDVGECKDWHEVVIITMDDRGLVRPDQWSFSLEAEPEAFKETFKEIGKIPGVIWRVSLARDGDRSLCEILQTWNPFGWMWRRYQTEIYEKIFGGRDPWSWKVKEVAWFAHPLGQVSTKKQIEGAEVGVFFGPSWN